MKHSCLFWVVVCVSVFPGPLGLGGPGFSAPLSEKNDPLKCLLVLQGDLIEVDYYGRTEQVKLLGVKAPQFRPFGKDEPLAREARDFLKRILEGNDVYLEYDQQLLDDDQRILAYVYDEEGGLANARIIQQGLGRVSEDYPFRLKERFLEDERKARDRRIGIWRGVPLKEGGVEKEGGVFGQ